MMIAVEMEWPFVICDLKFVIENRRMLFSIANYKLQIANPLQSNAGQKEGQRAEGR
jgi:hypothetical protein